MEKLYVWFTQFPTILQSWALGAPCYHIQFTTSVVKNNFDASEAFKW